MFFGRKLLSLSLLHLFRQALFNASSAGVFLPICVSLHDFFNDTSMATTKELTVGSPFTLIFNFTLPLLLGNLLQQTYSLVDAAIVGKFLGIDALASVGASSSVIFLILGFCTGCCGGFGIPIAQKFGAHDYVTMRRYVWTSLRLAAVMSVVIAVVTSLLCAFILRSMRTPENIFHDAYLYLLVTFIGVPCTFFYNMFSSIIRALGDSKTPFWFLLFSTVLNIVLDLFCILVMGWGVAGAAIATVFSQGLSALLCYRYMMRRFEVLQGPVSERRMNKRLALTMLGIGVPMGLQFSITAIGSIMLQSANNALGTACVAAFTSAMLSGVSEMIARILVSVLAVPAFGYIAVCFGDPTAWVAADLFLIPTFAVIYRRMRRNHVVAPSGL